MTDRRPIVSGADGFSRLSGFRRATERGGPQQRSHSARTGRTGSKPGTCGPVTAAMAARANAYRALDAVAPNDAAMIASPENVLPYLPEHVGTGTSDEDDVPKRNAERHAFLLTLGVWEVIPVEAFESRDMQSRERIPWTGKPHELRMQRIAEAGGWRFVGHPWTGGEHRNVWIAEDFRFRWSLA